MAGAGGIAALGIGLLVSGCGAVQMGAAAIVGNQRITQSTLGSQVSNFNAAAAKYPGQVQLASAQVPSYVLSWLIRFAIEDRLAAQAHITLTSAQIQSGVSSVTQQITSQGVSLDVGLLDNGVPPQLLTDLGRYQAQLYAFAAKANGGKLPATQSQDNTVTAALTRAECTAAKSLNIKVNPQYGRFSYSKYMVVSGATATPLSAPAGPRSKPSTAGFAPEC
jgi:peptidyl-prolyl cis-trans isomerase SurA